MSSDLKDETQFDTRPRRSRESAALESTAPVGNPYAVLGDELAYPAVNPFAPEMDFCVDLSLFRGPLDLLLYLVRKHELDVMDIPIAMVTEQYISYLEILEQLDVDAAGDFVEIASMLIEIKSRMALPQVEDDQCQLVEDDPRDELVQRLLEYKKYKDAARMLSESGHAWQQRHPRVANDLPPRNVDPAEQPIHEVELWDLVSAIGRIVRDSKRIQPLTTIVYDDTPLQVHMQQLHELLIREGTVSFTSMFESGMHKSKVIGIFLAILELARNYGVVVEQRGIHGAMVMRCGEQFQPSLELSEVFTDFEGESAEDLATAKPR
jgi:segregation and condensation protein A